MDVVTHQHISVHINAQPSRVAREKIKVCEAIVVRKEARTAIVSPLHDVLRNPGQVEASATRHTAECSEADGAVSPSANTRNIRRCLRPV